MIPAMMRYLRGQIPRPHAKIFCRLEISGRHPVPAPAFGYLRMGGGGAVTRGCGRGKAPILVGIGLFSGEKGRRGLLGLAT
jgi:hypothetical protein